MKRQVIVIHGGGAHKSQAHFMRELKSERVQKEDFMLDEEKRWKNRLPAALGEEYEVFFPEMPNANSARYIEWKIWFDKIFQFLEDGPVFVGHSLGAIFLARYFAENSDKKKTRGVFLVAPPYGNGPKDGMADFIVPKNVSRLAKLGQKVHIYVSEDDPVVPIADFRKYAKLLPEALTTVFKDRGHFRQREFPEIVRDIREAFAK